MDSRAQRVPALEKSQLKSLVQHECPAAPLHILVPGEASRVRMRDVVSHVWSGNLPPHSLARIADDVFVSTPEFIFLQSAFTFSFIDLLKFGYELCALYTYRLHDGSHTELQYPMTTANALRSYLDGCAGAPGIRNARITAPLVLDRSRSLRESKLAISLTLPRMRGGQAVGGLELNREIPLTQAERRAAGRNYFEIDLYSENGRTGLEYFGKHEHEGKIRETRDIRRESILAGKGISVHGVTKSQAENVIELERLAKLITKARGERWRKPTPEQEARMRRLMRELYS